MKRKITISIALALSIVLASLTISDSPVEAQGNRRLVYDTGVITLGQNQILRLTVDAGSGNDEVRVRFGKINYGQQTCNENVCKALVSNENPDFGPIVFARNEAVWLDIDRNSGDSAVRGLVITNKSVNVNAEIINTMTGEVQSIIAVLIDVG